MAMKNSHGAESRLGADWEGWIFPTMDAGIGDQVVHVWVQAKRMYPGGRFEELRRSQLELLCRKAGVAGALPLLALYTPIRPDGDQCCRSLSRLRSPFAVRIVDAKSAICLMRDAGRESLSLSHFRRRGRPWG